MENKRQVGGSSSSFTVDLFGPKDDSSSSLSNGLFGSVFGPPSTGQGSFRKVDLGSQYGNAKHGTPDNIAQRNKGEPCNFSSSIYYGGQEVYSPKSQTTGSQHSLKKIDGGEDDPSGSNSNGASRGNWWQGSLYY